MRFTVYLSVACLVGTLWAGAEPTPPPARRLSLRECIELALRHNLDVQIERYTPEIARFNLASSYGVYDPTFNLSAVEQFVTSPVGVDPKKPGTDFANEITTDSVGPGISGLLPTGLTYDLTATADFLDARTDFSTDPKQAFIFPGGIRLTNENLASAGISLRQPLLKNSWIDVYRQRIWINKKNLKISELALRWQIMNTIAAVQLAYHDLVFARENVSVREKALELAAQLLAETRKRVAVGDLPPLDETQAESQVETTQTDLYAAQQTLAEQQNLLKNLVTDDFKAWTGVDIEPAESLLAVPAQFDLAESWQAAMTSRPDLLQFRLELEKQDVLVRYRFNQLFPSLDLVGGYSASALSATFGAAAADVGERNNPAYLYGVVLSIPLSNRTARNDYKASQAARTQSRLQLKKLEQMIQVQIDNSVKLAASTFKRAGSTRQARIFAAAALDAEEKKLQNGASTSFFVLEFQRKLTDARTAEIRALADYNKALAQLALHEGMTLEQNQLSFEVK
ncbi:MAG: TolC family protein [Limisphaerales bacterium]